MALDMVRPIGVENPAEGGTQTAKDLTEFDDRSDAASVAGVYLQGGVTTPDRQVLMDRNGSLMRFTDSSTQRNLSDLMTSVQNAVNSHNQNRDIQHFLAGEGPGDGFTSGSFLQRNFSGALLTSEVWYTTSAQTVKIYSKVYSYTGTAVVPSTITYTMYSATGAVLRTVVDSLTYTGPNCTSISRTWS